VWHTSRRNVIWNNKSAFRVVWCANKYIGCLRVRVPRTKSQVAGRSGSIIRYGRGSRQSSRRLQSRVITRKKGGYVQSVERWGSGDHRVKNEVKKSRALWSAPMGKAAVAPKNVAFSSSSSRCGAK
jgi:hypothetical protein